jgi:hypothetical protein
MLPLALVAALCVPTSATATTLTLDSTIQFSNAVLPGGPAPWLRATFDDTAAGPGFDVRLTLQVIGLVGQEFVSAWGFNLNPAILNPSATVDVSPVNFSAVGSATVTWGTDCCSEDGGGLYDVGFTFPTAAGPGRFTNGESVVIDFNLTTGTLLASDFNFLATPQGGNGPFRSAAHIQGIGVDGGLSTWVADNGATLLIGPSVPEPSSLVLLGSGLALALGRLRRRRA